MPKILCIISLVISVLVFMLFGANLAAGVPFGPAGGIWMNLGMVLGSAIVAVFSVLTFRTL